MNKQQTERIIDYFGGKTLNKVNIGDVLEKMVKDDTDNLADELLQLWGEIDYSKSLQEIVEENGFKEMSSCGHSIELECACNTGNKIQLKSHQARELFKFLETLIT